MRLIHAKRGADIAKVQDERLQTKFQKNITKDCRGVEEKLKLILEQKSSMAAEFPHLE